MAAAGARSQLIQALGRVAMLLVWSFVVWGALLFAATLANALGEGPAAAFARLVPAQGASIWGWLGPLSVLLALAAGLVAGGLAVWNRTNGPQ